MATIDIRKNISCVDKIRFSDDNNESVRKLAGEYIAIIDSYEDRVDFRIEDIDNLIKALQKAKEIWK